MAQPRASQVSMPFVWNKRGEGATMGAQRGDALLQCGGQMHMGAATQLLCPPWGRLPASARRFACRVCVWLRMMVAALGASVDAGCTALLVDFGSFS